MIFEIAGVGAIATYFGARVLQQARHKPKLYEVIKAEPTKPAAALVPYAPESKGNWLRELDSQYHRFIQQHIDPLFGSKRHEQMQTLSMPDTDVKEKEVNYMLGIAGANLGWAIACGLFAPSLMVTTAIPVLFMVYKGPLQWAYHSVIKERRVTVAVLDSVTSLLALSLGYYFIISLSSFVAISMYKAIARIKDSSQQRLVEVFSSRPQFVWIMVDGIELTVPFEALKVGDTFVVQAGETVPADGKIVQGIATIDQHALTGESQPAEKVPHDLVLASTTVLSGKIYVEVTQAGADTVAAKIGELLNQTTDHKTGLEIQALKLANRSTTPTLIFGILAAPIVGAAGSLALLCASFGYSMRALGPISTLSFLQMTSDKNILIKDGRSLDVLPNIDTVVFDKTGTLTQERPSVSNLYPCNGFSAEMLLTYGAAAEYKQTHPTAKAILQATSDRHLILPKIDEAKYEIGYGLKVQLENQTVRVGSRRFLELENIPIPDEIEAIQTEREALGYSLVMVAIGNQLAGAIELQPTIRPEAQRVIQKLQLRGLKTYIISGDQEEPTRSLAEALGIDHYFANTLPEQKAALIEKLQQEGKTVCFIGDGINDSIALRKADVSVSLSGATTAAIDTAQIILMDGRLSGFSDLLAIAESFQANQQVNFALSVVPSAVSVSGVFLLHTGIYFASALSYSSLFLGITNSTRPLLKSST